MLLIFLITQLKNKNRNGNCNWIDLWNTMGIS